VTREELVTLAHELAQRHGFPYDIRDSIPGFRHAREERLRGGQMLRDP
jgi:hypothetical protein